MSSIIAAKYGGPCVKCGKKIKAGRFVNWERGRGIWHLDETDNKKLSFSTLDPGHVEDGCHPKAGGLPPDTHHEEEKTMNSEEKIMGSNGNDDTINVNDLIRALQGIAGEVAKPPAKKEKQLVEDGKVAVKNHTRKPKPLTHKQISFCELMALGSDKADAYTDSYDISNPAFSGNAARRLLGHKKIRDKITELRGDLENMTGHALKDIEYPTKSWVKGTGKGWIFKITEKQENFCQARANGDTIVNAFKESGYFVANWTDKKIRRHANRLMKLTKITNRIADIMSGRAPDIKAIVAGEDSHVVPRTGTGPTSVTKSILFTGDGTQVGTVSMPDLVELNEFVDNFMELIKAHGRLFHHAVVTRGQKEVGIPGADVKGVEDAVGRSIETLRETLGEKLLIPRAKINSEEL
jgi:hypothetical protein